MNAIVTICVGELYKKIAEFTYPTIKKYADRLGADFVIIDESNSSSPHWEKCIIFHLLNKYERILYLDTDLIVRDDCPDLFALVPSSKLGIFNEAPFTPNRQESLFHACKDYGVKLNNWNGKYYNTGVMVISRVHKYIFKKPDKEIFNFYEQGYLNMVFAQNMRTSESQVYGLEMLDLSYKFNRMACMDSFTGEERHASFIIHYAGFPSLDFVLQLISKDLKKWQVTSPNYYYPRHILINVGGGLGDQVNAEPAIRFLKNHVYPGDDISIQTHFPELFKHLDLPTYFQGEFIPKNDTPYYSIKSLPEPGTITWDVVSNLLCHTIDFCSMALLRRTLPLKDRQPILITTLDDTLNMLDVVGERDFDNMVLIHPGRHWESKTFPLKWWQEVIDGFQDKGIQVCLIGYEDETRGTIPIEVHPGVIDTRNLLNVGGLISLISKAKVLISNDSAPIHIAGAFDNYIVLIPTCKHPDHVLPYRHGSVNYKSVALYKKLTLDAVSSQPTEVHGQRADHVVGNILDYLPEPKEVIKTVEEICNKRLVELKSI